MPTYQYETMDNGPREVLEIYQRMMDKALTKDPASGRPIRRIISGGLEMPRGKSDPPKIPRPRHSDSCACCNPRA